jgi:trigger factor
VNITVNPINSVDKEIIVISTRDDLNPRFEKALKEIRKKASLPGFRVGMAPMGMIRKRFAKEVEAEEINTYIQDIFRDTIYPEYKPVGEPKITDLKWENDVLEVKYLVGVKPEFELIDIKSLTVDKLVHDVTEEEVDKEVEHARVRRGTYIDSEDTIEASSKITADVKPLDDHGHETGVEEGQEFDLSEPDNAAIQQQVIGKKIGDTVEVTIEHGDHSHRYSFTVKTHQKSTPAELNEAFIKDASRGEATTVDEYRSFLKSRIQEYFDKTSADFMKEEIADTLVEAHDFEVPESVVDMVTNTYVEDYKRRAGGKLPEDFDFNDFKASSYERARKETKWMFIQDKLAESSPEIEITAADVDSFMAEEAAKYGLTVEMIKQFYASSTDQIENLRQNLRSQKLFDKLMNEISFKELDKETFQNRNK